MVLKAALVSDRTSAVRVQIRRHGCMLTLELGEKDLLDSEHLHQKSVCVL